MQLQYDQTAHYNPLNSVESDSIPEVQNLKRHDFESILAVKRDSLENVRSYLDYSFLPGLCNSILLAPIYKLIFACSQVDSEKLTTTALEKIIAN